MPSTQVPFEPLTQFIISKLLLKGTVGFRRVRLPFFKTCFSFLSAVHIIAHLFNFERFMDAQLEGNSSSLPHVLSRIGSKGNESFLNPIRSNETVSTKTARVSVLIRI